MAKKWSLPEGVDEDELRRQIILSLLKGETFRRTARKFSVRELYVEQVIRDVLNAADAERKAADTRPPYEWIAVRQTPTQHSLVFERKDCPVKKTSLQFHLNYEEASELIGWLNDEIVEEQDALRQKALRNLLQKVLVEERRREA
jgi:hypothetical protein